MSNMYHNVSFDVADPLIGMYLKEIIICLERDSSTENCFTQFKATGKQNFHQ